MKPEDFISKVNHSLQTGNVDKDLLSHESRFLRSKYILKMIENVSKVLNCFQFKDSIIFEETLPYINFGDIKLKLNSALYLKNSVNKFYSQSLNSIRFIKHIQLNPKLIIDLGACWGEYSLFFAKEYPNSKILSIEGSPLNYDTLEENVKLNKTFGKIIKTFNLIITDFDGIEKITNNLSGMNMINSVRSLNNKFVQVKSKKLTSFLIDEGISEIDFIKIDIEGAELKLLNDLENIKFKLLQVELIDYNGIESNLNFVKSLSEFCFFYDYKSYKKLSLLELEDLIITSLKEKPTIDLFCIKKSNYKFNNEL